MKLARLSQALGFEVWKGYFLNFFNTAENKNYVSPHRQPEFVEWTALCLRMENNFFAQPTSNKETVFDLEKKQVTAANRK